MSNELTCCRVLTPTTSMNPMGAQSTITVLTGTALHGRKTAATMTAHTKIIIHVKIDTTSIVTMLPF